MMTQHLFDVLNNIHSLGRVTEPDQLRKRDRQALMALGYIRQCWINTFVLTEAGEQARRERRA